MYNPFTLKDKTILVIGASSGIGQSIAVECSKMEAKVIISARNEENLKETLSLMSGDGHQIIVGDITIEEDLNRIVDSVPELDGLVLSAGMGLTLPIPFSTRDKYDKIFEINFFAQVEAMRLLYKKKKIVKEGSVVIVSSIGGVHIYSVGNSIYGASKAAMNSIMHFSAREFAVRKIRVNSICPGMVNTKLIQRGTLSPEDLARDKELYPLKRYGEPEDIAKGAIYLLSDASSWVTGHALVIDGGVTSK